MSELRDYQKKMLESKSKVVFCNWDRGEGKTYSICEKIFNIDGKVLYIGLSDSHFGKQFEDFLRENAHYETLVNLTTKRDCVNFTRKSIYSDRLQSNRIDIKSIGSLDSLIGARYDYVFFDETIPDKKTLDSIIKPMCKNQIYIMNTIEESEFEYIDSSKKLNKIKWIDKQIEDLMNEFSGIIKNEKTTMTREKVLGLIENLMKLKSNYNCKY